MKPRAIWTILASLPVGLPAGCAAWADPAAIVGRLKGAAASRRLSNTTAHQKQ